MNERDNERDGASHFRRLSALIVVIFVLVIGAVAAAIWLAPQVKPYLGFPASFFQCGMKQPVIGVKVKGKKRYVIAGDRLYTPGPGAEYFCTEKAAKHAGYRSLEN